MPTNHMSSGARPALLSASVRSFEELSFFISLQWCWRRDEHYEVVAPDPLFPCGGHFSFVFCSFVAPLCRYPHDTISIQRIPHNFTFLFLFLFFCEAIRGFDTLSPSLPLSPYDVRRLFCPSKTRDSKLSWNARHSRSLTPSELSLSPLNAPSHYSSLTPQKVGLRLGRTFSHLVAIKSP